MATGVPITLGTENKVIACNFNEAWTTLLKSINRQQSHHLEQKPIQTSVGAVKHCGTGNKVIKCNFNEAWTTLPKGPKTANTSIT